MGKICVKVLKDRRLDVLGSVFGGVQGDISSSQIEWDITDIFELESRSIFRIEWFYSGGQFDSSLLLSPVADGEKVVLKAEYNNKLCLPKIPYEIFSSGGNCAAYLIEEQVENEQTVKRVCSYPLKIRLLNKATGKTDISVSEYERGISSMYLEVKSCKDEYNKLYNNAKEELENAKNEFNDAKDVCGSFTNRFEQELTKKQDKLSFADGISVDRSNVISVDKQIIADKEWVNEKLDGKEDKFLLTDEALEFVENGDGNNYLRIKLSDNITTGEYGDLKVNTAYGLANTPDNRAIAVDESVIPSREDLEKKQDKQQYKHIETITTEEAVSSVVRSAKPDGTAYCFDAVKVLMEIPAVTNPTALIITMSHNQGNNWVSYYNNASGIGTAKGYLCSETFKRNGHWTSQTHRATSEYAAANLSSQCYNLSDKSDSSNYYKNIDHLKIEGKIPAGTKIRIYGVESNEN